jgi:site-specific DNA-methyltransferase (cytosine-N4-specific)
MSAWGHTHQVEIADHLLPGRRTSIPIYETGLGAAYCGDSLRILRTKPLLAYRGKVQLAFTSPPFPLNTKKSYGNLQGEAYIRWFAKFAPLLRELVTDDGSIVIEIGNAWLPGEPVMSTHVLEAFLRFLKKGDLHLCQEFIWYNPARLPSPVEWVNKDRVRVKDAFTRIWWMSPTTRPKADNRKVLQKYSPSMRRLIQTGKYNAGPRPSQHNVGADSFKADNGGAIPSNVGGAGALPSLGSAITPKAFAEFLSETGNLLKAANTLSSDGYRAFCVALGVPVHPARMPRTLVEFFLRFLTDEGDAVVDPFAGSNTTGEVAESLGRRWVSVEADWTYAAHSIGRFDPAALIRTCKEINVAAAPPRADGALIQSTEASASSETTPLVTS